MSTDTLTTLIAVGVGVLVGYFLGHHTGSKDTKEEIRMRVNSLLNVGETIARLNHDRRIPWDRVKENLTEIQKRVQP